MTATNARVSAPDAHDLDRRSRRYPDMPTSPRAEDAEGIEPAETSGGMFRYGVATAGLHHVPVTGKTHEGTSVGDAKGPTEKFGSLKTVLEAIPAFCANREVRQRLPTQDAPLTNEFPGVCRRRKQDRGSPVAYRWFGKMFRFTSRWGGGAEAAG